MAKKYYIVMITMKAGYDDTIDGEYSGMIHTRKSDAQAEYREAYQHVYKDSCVIGAYIKEIEN